jgi:hypothetical protein
MYGELGKKVIGMSSCKNSLFTKIVGVLLLLFVSSMAVQAQFRPIWSVTGAMEANELIVDLYGDHRVPTQLGFAVNGFAKLPIGKHFAFRTGLGYAYKRIHHFWDGMIRYTDIDPNGNIIGSTTMKERSRYHEIQVPILFEYHFGSLKDGIFLGIGPMPSIVVANKLNIDFESTTGFREHDLWVRYSPRFNIAMQACLGYNLALGEKRSLGIEAYGNYYLGQYELWPARMINFGLRLGISL